MERRARKAKPVAYLIAESEREEAVVDYVRVRAQSGRSRGADRSRARVLMCAVAFSFVFLSLAGRLAFVSFGAVDFGGRSAPLAGAQIEQPELVDRNGALLATELPVIALEISGRDVWDANEAAEKLATVLPDIDVPLLAKKLRDGRYVEVRADLTPSERREIFALGIPGVRFAARATRIYPQADLAAHVIGHNERGKGGVMGLERYGNGRGSNTTLVASLDIRVQKILEDEIAFSVQKFSANAGWGAVMDVQTGEMLALASYPDFDPNAPGAAPADSRRNRAVYDLYELGSAFKAITAAAALEAGVADEATTYDARGNLQIADWRISDFHGENRVLTLSEVVQHSSNIGIARLVADLGVANQKDFLRRLGFFEALNIELAETRTPQLPQKWGPVESATVGYGHGISVTPLHLLAGFAAVVNGGVYHAPTFMKDDSGKNSARVFSEETSAVMRRILRRVITDGTADFAEASGYFPIGKTATADKPSPDGGYNRNTRIASFVGAFPGYAPRYAILVSLDEPKPLPETYGYATAGWNAAPAFSRIVDRAAPLLGVAQASEALALAAFVSGDMAPYQEARLMLVEEGGP